MDLQVADDSLLPLEQIGVGGRYTVRGYRENLMVRDNGLISSLELRIPVVRGRAWADYILLAPFVDFGKAWNNKLETPDPKEITGSGVGLLWAVTFLKPIRLRPQFEFYWGYPFTDIETTDSSLQDDGIYLQFVLEAL
jgi:hemolysin activation/secretion protein